jgi:mannitol/fructose-specific phosphotransferase system IIA component (Ntr-type)
MHAGITVTEIYQLLTPSTIRVGLPGRTKEESINALIDLLRSQPGVRDLEGVRKAVFDREAIMSTGVGKGLRSPTPKQPL